MACRITTLPLTLIFKVIHLLPFFLALADTLGIKFGFRYVFVVLYSFLTISYSACWLRFARPIHTLSPFYLTAYQPCVVISHFFHNDIHPDRGIFTTFDVIRILNVQSSIAFWIHLLISYTHNLFRCNSRRCGNFWRSVEKCRFCEFSLY